MTHSSTNCTKYNEQVLPDENGKCSLCGAVLIEDMLTVEKSGENMETVPVNKEDLNSWAGRLESLRKCMLEPEKCTHEGGCDYAAVDSCLDQIISEIKSTIK